jgi:hypothetical protein
MSAAPEGTVEAVSAAARHRTKTYLRAIAVMTFVLLLGTVMGNPRSKTMMRISRPASQIARLAFFPESLSNGYSGDSMKGLTRIVLAAAVPALVLGLTFATSRPEARPSQAGPASGRLPSFIVANEGQADARAAYYLAGRDRAVFFRRGGISIVLTGAARWTVGLDFVGADRAVLPEGEDRTRAVLSFFKGGRDEWRTGVPTYARLAYRDLWPGIDLVYATGSDRLKYEFVVHPGSDPAAIGLGYKGASSVSLRDDGRILVETPAGSFEDAAPVAYQEKEGRRVPVAASFALEGTTCRFALGGYDPALPLVIDPAILIYAGYIGGAADDRGAAIARDAEGNVYVTGSTESIGFPVEVGPDLTFNSVIQAPDAFVAKIDASGEALVYCGYIGGNQGDAGTGIAVDGSGNAYIAGWTRSTDFPVTIGPGLTYHGGSSQFSEAFVAKVDAAGEELVYCGYIGGSADDEAAGIAVDGSGNAYVAGWTESSDLSRTVGPDLSFNGGLDAFVAKVNAAGTGFVYSGYLGGSVDDFGAAIAVDGQGRAVVAGGAVSRPSERFPVLTGPYLTHAGGQDGFVARVAANGAALEYCGYIGGSGDDVCTAVALDASGAAYVAGATASRYQFPASVGPDLSFNGGVDAFAAKVSPSGAGLSYCGYIGGSGEDQATAVAVDAAGIAYVAGYTDSASGFPVSGGPELIPSGYRDAFLVTVVPSGGGLYYGGYLGGSADDGAAGVAADGSGNVWLTGYTASGDFPVLVGPYLTPGGYGYDEDAFVAKVFEDLPPAAPANLRSSGATVGSIVLAWDDESANEDGFEVERKSGSAGTWAPIATVGPNVETYTDAGRPEATAYFYRVRATNETGDSAWSNEAEMATLPAGPTGLGATAVNSRRVDLTWADHSGGETGFRVERRTDPGAAWVQTGLTAANVTAYSDRQVVEETTYYYRVLAYNIGGDSAPSNTASATTPVLTIPAAPSGLTAVAASSFTVDLAWTDNSYDEDGFRIERMTAGGGTWAQVATAGADVTAYHDTGLAENTGYVYRVLAYNNAGASPYSNEAPVTTPEYRPRLRVPISGVSFGNVNICSSNVLSTTLYNDGTAPLTVSAVNRTSGAAQMTYASPSAPFVVPAGGSMAVSVRFAPVDVAASSATFAVLSDDPDNPSASFAASGSGFLPAITIALSAERLTERAWIIRRDYARLVVTVTKSAPFVVDRYRLMRRAGSGAFETVREFADGEIPSGLLVYNDAFLASGTVYVYRMDALDCQGRTIASSSETGPAAPKPDPRPKTRTLRKRIP